MSTSIPRMRVGLAVVLALGAANASAVALRPDRPTDNSVCDLGPNTVAVLDRQIFVSADAARADQAQAYFRLAARFVAQQCANGQTLLMDAPQRAHAAAEALGRLAASACAAADVASKPATLIFGDLQLPGTTWRCTVLKTAELREQLAELERAEPLATLQSRLRADVTQPQDSPSTEPVSGPAACSKPFSLSTLLRGGGAPCR